MVTERRSIAALIESARAAESAGDWDRALAGYEEAVDLAAAASDRVRLCELLRSAGRVHFERGAYGRASELYEASLATAMASELHEQTAAALNCMASAAQMRGRLEVAEALYTRAAGAAEQAGDRRLAAAVNQNRGTLSAIRGQFPEALERFRRAADLLRELGDDRSAAQALNNMGMVSVDVEDWGAADISFAAARELAERVHDPRLLGRVEVNRAEMYLLRQNYQAARESCDAAQEIFARIGSESGLAECHKQYGALFREIGQLRRSEIELGLALRLAQTCENQLLEAEVESELARLHAVRGHTRQALQSLNRAYRLFELTEARREVHDVERRLDRLEDTYFRALQLLEHETTEESEAEPEARYHRVAELACALAERVGCRGRELTWLRIASYLYDIGKAYIPVEVLNKPGPLSEAEWELVRRHPVSAAELAGELGFPASVVPLVRHHHEHWDGSGYPDGLEREGIPLQARILCLADAFDALTSERSFRPALPEAKALETMDTQSGQVFDPELLRLLRDVLNERRPGGR